MTKLLNCNNIIQHEAFDERKGGVVETYPGLLWNASGLSGYIVSQVWQQGVSLRARGEAWACLLSLLQRRWGHADGLYSCFSVERSEEGDGGFLQVLGAWGEAVASKFGTDGIKEERC